MYPRNEDRCVNGIFSVPDRDERRANAEIHVDSRRDEPSDFRGLALVPVQQYFPGGRFSVVARLPAATTVAMLAAANDARADVLPRPDEFYGYAVELLQFGSPVYGFVFSKTLLTTRFRYRLFGDPTVFGETLNLIASPFAQTRTESNEGC